MKKVISKILIILILIILLFEFLFSNSLISYAAEDPVGLPVESIENILSLANGPISIILWIPKFVITAETYIFNRLIGIIAKMENTDDPGVITPYKIFFGKYDLLSVNMFKDVGTSDGFGKVFRQSIATWYYIVRLIAVVILLVILVYVGIRMALASVADDKAKYKKMLFDWVVGLALIFVMHYIAIFTVYCNDAIVHAIESAYSSSTDGAEEMISAICEKALIGVGMIADFAMIVYIGIVFQTLFYLLAYINRTLKVGFLLVISPLITVTYSIDKMGDGKAQALEAWLKEYIYTILIQPFHCIIYYSFIGTAFSLVVPPSGGDYSYNTLAAGVLAILCIKFINDAEKIVRKIFGFQDDNSKTSMAAGAIMGVALAKNAAKMASGVKGGITKIGNTGVKLNKLKKDFIREAPKMQALLGDKGVGKILGESIGGAAAALKETDKLMNKGKDWAKNTKIGKGASALNKRVKGAKTAVGRFRNTKAGHVADYVGRKTVAASAAVVAFAASYATGDTDALSAVGYGSALGKATDEMFNNSSKRNENNAITNNHNADKIEYENMKEDLEKAKEEEEPVREIEQEQSDFNDAVRNYRGADNFDEQADKKENEIQAEKLKLNSMKKGSPEYNKTMNNIATKQKDAKELREKANKARAKAKEIDDNQFGGNIAKEHQNGTSYKDIRKNADKEYADKIAEKTAKSRALERSLREFYSEKASAQRFKARRNSVTDQTIKDKAKDIEKLIQEMIAKRNQIANSGNDNAENVQDVSYEDMAEGRRISNMLQANIQKDFIEHSMLSSSLSSSRDLLEKAGGEFLSTDFGEGEVDKELVKEMNEMSKKLDRLIREQQVNYCSKGIDDSARVDEAMGRSKERFDASMLKSVVADSARTDRLNNK